MVWDADEIKKLCNHLKDSIMKIAVTTTDGVSVNQHFGKASEFYIYNIKGNQVNFVEKRFAVSYCESDSTTDEPEHEYKPDRILGIFEILKDCDKLYTKQIGDKPLKGLIENGIIVQPCSCAIHELAICEGKCK